MTTPLSAPVRHRLLCVTLCVLASGVAWAAPTPQLTLPAGATVTLQPGALHVTGPQLRELAQGNQVCVDAGSAVISEGGVRHALTAGQCYQVPAPRSLVSSLLSLAASWLPSSRKADTVNAESRGEGRCDDRAPGVALPSTYSLETLTIPVASRPYPNTVEAFSGTNELLFHTEQARPGSGFEVPVAMLRGADHVEIRDGKGKLLYRGAVSRVTFPAAADKNLPAAAQAQQLLETGLIDYALPAYSLLVQAGEHDAAAQILSIIRTCFVVPTQVTSSRK